MIFYKVYLKYEALTQTDPLNGWFGVVTENTELYDDISNNIGKIHKNIHSYDKKYYFLILSDEEFFLFKLTYNDIIISYEEVDINVHPIDPTNNR